LENRKPYSSLLTENYPNKYTRFSKTPQDNVGKLEGEELPTVSRLPRLTDTTSLPGFRHNAETA
jgi:hypothetical protein